MENDTSVAWVAGLLEGEGSFVLREGRVPVVSCSMTDKDVIEKLHSLAGGSLYELGRQKDHHKDVYKVQICGESAAKLMEIVLPHMGARRSDQIKAVLIGYRNYRNEVEEKKIEWTRKIQSAVDFYRNNNVSYKIAADKYGISHKTVSKYDKLQ